MHTTFIPQPHSLSEPQTQKARNTSHHFTLHKSHRFLSGKASNNLSAMAKTGIAALNIALMAALWTVSTAQSSSSCTNVLISMSPCLSYITGNSSTPSSGCCSQLSSVVNSQPQCLCQVISGNGASSLGININRTQALELPTACKVQTPPISRCNGASSPSGSPSTSTSSTPSSSSSGTTTTPATSTGSKAVPTGDKSEGHATKTGLALFIAVFLIASPAWELLSVAM